VRISGRSGVDLSPVDPIAEAERLLAYVWPDQPQRQAQLELALDIAALDPPAVARGDAADWLDAQLKIEPEQGVCRVILHSIAFQYFPADTQERVKARLRQVGELATETAPLAWLRLEMLPADDKISLRLRTWPGEGRLLAWSHPHAGWINWLSTTGSEPVHR
jgi:hypothetical protein